MIVHTALTTQCDRHPEGRTLIRLPALPLLAANQDIVQLGALGCMAANEHETKMAHPRMAAGALFFDADGRVLMVEPTYKDYWDIPGGYVETGESPLQAADREVHEELGITPPGRRLGRNPWRGSASRRRN
ncbi:NUDIX domain-containing protein [Streptomyces sp. NPDC002516]